MLLALLIAASVGLGAFVWGRSRSTGPVDPARRELLKAALDQFNAGAYEDASRTLDRRGDLVKATSLDWMLRARIAHAQGRSREALDHLKRIPDSSTIASKTRLFAGQIQIALHRPRLAEKEFIRSIELEPIQIQPHRELISIYTLQRRSAECDAQFRELSKIADLDLVLAFAWSQNTCGLLDPDEAIGILRKCVAADPEDLRSRMAFATVCLWSHSNDELKQALEPLPADDPDVCALLVEDALDRAEIGAAEALSSKVNATSTRLEVARAKIALARLDLPGAAAAFRRALSQDLTDQDAVRGLGLVLRRLGDPEAGHFLDLTERHDELKRLLHAAIHLDKADPRLHLKLGTLCESLRLVEQARTWYRLVLASDPANAPARAALERLDATP